MDCEERSDRECVQEAQSGDTDAFDLLLRRHQRGIFNWLYRWLGNYDEAVEVAQEVFLSAFRNIKGFRGESSFGIWLYRIGVNQAGIRRRGLFLAARRQGAARAGDPENPSPSDPAKEVEQRGVHLEVQRGLDALPAEEALLIVLHDLQGLRSEEIATVLDMPLGTIRSRLHRARQALKKTLLSSGQEAMAVTECEEIQAWLSDYLDGELDSGRHRAVEDHLYLCPICLAESDALAGIIASVASLPRVEPPAELSRRVMGRVREEAGRS